MSARGFSVTLHRDGHNQPWGIRVVGGCDLGKPLVITRAIAGTPAEGFVKPGDEVLQIGDYDSRDITHQDAQSLFKNAGNSIRLVIHRVGSEHTGRSRECSLDPLGLPKGSLSERLFEQMGSGSYNSNACHSRSSSALSFHRDNEDELRVTEQPYRTTPLVLPGAKVKKDFGPTESYLRHHPNPTFRQAAPHPLLPHEIAMKQRISHKQFNSPIGLYSEQNIVDTINAQTAPAVKKTVVFDPVKSETYKALHDQEADYAQEVTPIPTRVFTPVKPKSVPHPVPAPHALNATGQTHEEIQQSNTFKRLMHMVQTEGVY
ncbi:PDZ and LIM domain protein 3 isoform X2 [Cimex lectularius]|uniref:PDZ domain-containing protein n=1 Tax=Cimex lectularius TaxID=79782 RepID=A0A8I6RRQ9_CIMLE|nr:PDZ and LIM domain protein 3 isoform X2 [Cimex lectularius]